MNLKLTVAILVLVYSLADARGRGGRGSHSHESSSAESNSTESADGDAYDREEARWWYNGSSRLVRADARLYSDGNNNSEVSYITIWVQRTSREGKRAKIYISNSTVAVRIGKTCTVFDAPESIEDAGEKVKNLNGTAVTTTSTIYVNVTRQLSSAEVDEYRGICSKGKGNNYFAVQVSAPGNYTEKTYLLDSQLVITNDLRRRPRHGKH